MTAPWSPRPDAAPASAEQPATTPPPQVPEPVDELAVLDQLEADLSAVEQAIESLEQVSTEGLVGEAAARRIAAAVSTERFGSDLVGDGLVDQ